MSKGTVKAKLRSRLGKTDSHLICYGYSQTQEFLKYEPDMPLWRFVQIMNRARYLDEQGTPYHFVGTQIYVDSEENQA